jgi:hypothetical protein
MKAALYTLSVGLVAAALGCGGKPAEAPTTDATPTETAKPRANRNAPSMHQELGSVDKAKVQKAFDGTAEAMMNCFKNGSKRVETLAGDVKFFVRIAHDGSTKYAFIEGGDLGDRLTEKCMIDQLGAVHWPSPEEGDEAEARFSTGFDVHDVRPAGAWAADKVPSTVTASKAVAACTAGAHGFSVTVYVAPDGKKGRIQAAGVAVTSKEAAEKADCLAGAFVGAETPSPGGWVAKTTLSL